MSRGKRYLVVFLLALCARGIVFSLVASHPHLVMQPDSRTYVSLAQGLSQHGTLCHPETPGAPDAERMPGYPLFLAVVLMAFGGSLLGVVAVQAVLDSLNCLLICAIGERIRRGAGLLSGVVAGLHLGMITYAHFVLNETLFLSFFLTALLLLLGVLEKPSWRKAALAGGFIGVATLIRPAASYLPLGLVPLLFVLLVLRGRVSVSAAAGVSLSIGLAFAVVILPWVFRNHSHYNRYGLTSQGGDHLLLYVVPYVWQSSKGTPFIEGMRQVNDLLKERAQDAKVDLASMPPFERSDFEVRLALEYLRQESGASVLKAWIAGTIKNLFAPSFVDFSYLLGTERPRFSSVQGRGIFEQFWNFFRGTQGPFQWVLLLSLLVTAAARLVQVLGLFVTLRNRACEVTLFLFVMIYFLAISGPVGYAKYRLPFEPILIVLLAAGLRSLFSKRTESAFRGRIPLGL